MRFQVTILATILTLISAGSGIASEIYKWVDDDGQVHYGDRPTGVDTEKRLTIASRPTNPEAVQAEVQARLAAQEARSEAKTEQQKGPTQEELRAEAADRAQKCTTYRERQKRFIESRHLYREDENGERVYLDEAQMDQARQRAQDQVDEYCSS